MRREPDDARGTTAPTPPGGAPAMIDGRRSRLYSDEHDALLANELAFPKEADTLRTQEMPVLPRWDTMPAPPAEVTHLSTSALHDDDIFEDDGLDDDTQTDLGYFEPSDEPTSPTLSLANRSDAAREVYRRFLASEYAPALELANDLIAQGEDDPMLVTIARECRSSIAALSSSAPPPLDDGALRPPSSPLGPAVHTGMFDATMTIEEVASLTGAPVEHVLALLERFVAMGVLPARRPR